MNHTPTPYEVTHDMFGINGINVTGIVASNNFPIANLGSSDVGKANAQFIVRACNAHEKLIEIIKKLSTMAPSDEGLGGRAPLSAFICLAHEARMILARIQKG